MASLMDDGDELAVDVSTAFLVWSPRRTLACPNGTLVLDRQSSVNPVQQGLLAALVRDTTASLLLGPSGVPVSEVAVKGQEFVLGVKLAVPGLSLFRLTSLCFFFIHVHQEDVCVLLDVVGRNFRGRAAGMRCPTPGAVTPEMRG